MRYINTKTGAMIDSPCAISGGDWIVQQDPEETSEELDLNTLTNAQLKELAANASIDLGDATKKDDIIAVIQEAMLDPEETSEE